MKTLAAPLIHLPEALSQFLKIIIDRVSTPTTVNELEPLLALYPSSSPHILLAWNCMHLHIEANEIIENLNLTIEYLSVIGRSKRIPRAERMKRYRLLHRLYYYEFSRMTDVLGHFAGECHYNGIITKPLRDKFRDTAFKRLEPMIKQRNALMHAYTTKSMEEVVLDKTSPLIAWIPKMQKDSTSPVQSFASFSQMISKEVISGRIAARLLAREVQGVLDSIARTRENWTLS